MDQSGLMHTQKKDSQQAMEVLEHRPMEEPQVCEVMARETGTEVGAGVEAIQEEQRNGSRTYFKICSTSGTL